MFHKGLTHEELCENQKALECYEKMNNLEPKHGSLMKFRALNSKARILGKLGRYQEQLDCYEIMLKNKATALSNKPYGVKSQSKRYIVVEASIREIKAKLRSEENLR